MPYAPARAGRAARRSRAPSRPPAHRRSLASDEPRAQNRTGAKVARCERSRRVATRAWWTPSTSCPRRAMASSASSRAVSASAPRMTSPTPPARLPSAGSAPAASSGGLLGWRLGHATARSDSSTGHGRTSLERDVGVRVAVRDRPGERWNAHARRRAPSSSPQRRVLRHRDLAQPGVRWCPGLARLCSSSRWPPSSRRGRHRDLRARGERDCRREDAAPAQDSSGAPPAPQAHHARVRRRRAPG